MKRKVITLVCICALFVGGIVNAKQDIKDNAGSCSKNLSFGLEIGLDMFFNPINKNADYAKLFKNILGTDEFSFMKMFLGPRAFVGYRPVNEFEIGLNIGYARRSWALTGIKQWPVGQGRAVPAKGKYLQFNTNCIDIAIPFAWLPDGGISIYLGPKVYMLLSSSVVTDTKVMEQELPAELLKQFSDFHEKSLTSFNLGLCSGIKYDIMRTGVLIGGDFGYFFLDMYKESESKGSGPKPKAKEAKNKLTAMEAHVYLGVDFARIFCL